MSARCAYCDADLRPNSMFCLNCGQLVGGGVPPVPSGLTPPPTRPAAPAPPTASAPGADAAPVPLPSRWEAPGAPKSEPAPSARPTQVSVRPAALTIAFSTGDRVTVSGPAVIGRRPQSTAQNSGAQAVEVHDTSRSVSRVHLLLGFDDSGVSVTDAGSGNGSSLERGGVRTPLREGRTAQVLPGDRLWLGDVSAELTFL